MWGAASGGSAAAKAQQAQQGKDQFFAELSPFGAQGPGHGGNSSSNNLQGLGSMPVPHARPTHAPTGAGQLGEMGEGGHYVG